MTAFDWFVLIASYYAVGVALICVRHRAMLHGIMLIVGNSRPGRWYTFRSVLLASAVWPSIFAPNSAP